MISRIIVPGELKRAFRKAAEAKYPLEYADSIWGRLEGGTVTVEALGGLVQRGASPDKIAYNASDVFGPGVAGRVYLGSWHTHVGEGYDASPSLHDWQHAFQSGEHIFGITHITRKEREGRSATYTAVTTWWQPQPEIQMVTPREVGKVGKKPRKSRAKSEVVVPPVSIETSVVTLTNTTETA